MPQVEVLVVQRDIPSGATLAVIAAAVAPTQVPKRLVSTDALVSLDGVDPTLVAGVDLKVGEQLLKAEAENQAVIYLVGGTYHVTFNERLGGEYPRNLMDSYYLARDTDLTFVK